MALVEAVERRRAVVDSVVADAVEPQAEPGEPCAEMAATRRDDLALEKTRAQAAQEEPYA